MIKEELILEIQELFPGATFKNDTFDINIMPLIKIDENFKSKGFSGGLGYLVGEETNGWQVDFWYEYHKDGYRIVLSGSLWYGEYKLEIKN